MARSLAAMQLGRARKVQYLHAFGRKAPGGRPGRIDDWLRYTAIEDIRKELAGIDLDAIRTADPSMDMSEVEELAYVERYELVQLLDELCLPAGTKNRNRGAIPTAWNILEVRYIRVELSHRARNQLDELIEDVALCGGVPLWNDPDEPDLC